MYIAGFFALCVTILMMLLPLNPGRTRSAEALADARAMEFVAYRKAVWDFAVANPAFSGNVPPASLVFPAGIAIDTSRVFALKSGPSPSPVYVFSELPNAGALKALEILRQPAGVGIKQGGRLISPIYGDEGIVLPAAIPEGYFVWARAF